jgi:class 3 adenylate cyclase
MAAFVSAAAAVRCAIQIQKTLIDRPVRNGDAQVLVRIGAAAGEPVEANDDFFGSTVHLAARLCAHADSEQSLVSNVVAELCLGKGLTFHDLGEVALKGFIQPVRVHAVK